jgi:hypothetical protein
LSREISKEEHKRQIFPVKKRQKSSKDERWERKLFFYKGENVYGDIVQIWNNFCREE